MWTEQEAQNRETAIRLIGCFRTNPYEMFELLTPDCEFHIGSAKTRGIVPWYGIHKGRAQIEAYLDKRGRYLARHENNCGFEGPRRAPDPANVRGDGRDQVEKLLADGDTVVAIGHLTDHFRDDGKEMHSSDFVLVFKFEGGKIKKFQYFHDTDAIVQAWINKHEGSNYAR